jgi:hypothetical protein
MLDQSLRPREVVNQSSGDIGCLVYLPSSGHMQMRFERRQPNRGWYLCRRSGSVISKIGGHTQYREHLWIDSQVCLEPRNQANHCGMVKCRKERIRIHSLVAMRVKNVNSTSQMSIVPPRVSYSYRLSKGISVQCASEPGRTYAIYH